jgi:predicted dinucleotide-binding enzyme
VLDHARSVTGAAVLVPGGADFCDRAGFDAVDIGGLDRSWKIGLGQLAFVTRQNAQQWRDNTARAQR